MKASLPGPSNREIHEQLEEIFSRPEFGPGTRGPSWLERLLQSFAEWLSGLQDAAPVLFWLLIGGCIALLALLVLYIIRAVHRVLFMSSRLPGDRKWADQRGRLSATCREEALRRAARGEFTEAIRFLFLSLVYRFDEAGRVNFQRAYTNREYLAMFEDSRPLQADLKLFVDLLDEYWYGERPSSHEQYEQCEKRYVALTSQA